MTHLLNVGSSDFTSASACIRDVPVLVFTKIPKVATSTCAPCAELHLCCSLGMRIDTPYYIYIDSRFIWEVALLPLWLYVSTGRESCPTPLQQMVICLFQITIIGPISGQSSASQTKQLTKELSSSKPVIGELTEHVLVDPKMPESWASTLHLRNVTLQ